MKKIFFVFLVSFFVSNTYSQNVGIGTTAPQQKLHIVGSNEILRLQGNTPFVGFMNNSDASYKGFLYYPDTSLVFGTASSSNIPLVIAPNNTGLLYATAQQRVGIGTTNPAAKLHIDGTNNTNEVLRLDAEVSPFMSFFQSGAYKAYAGINNNGLDPIDFRIATTNGSNYPIKFFTNGNERMHIAANGNIGIGSPTTPLVPLHINSNISEALRVQGPTSYMTFYDDNNYRGYIQAWTNALGIGSTGTNSINFYTGGGAQRATILDNGKVGIGNNLPGAQLDINSNDAEVIKINSSVSPYIGFYNNNSYQGYVWGDGGLKIGTAASAGKTLRMYTNGQERISVIENGFVGIGYPTANYKLDVNGDINMSGSLRSNGLPGAAGEVLTSNGGGGTAPAWVSPTKSLYENSVQLTNTAGIIITALADIPGLTHTFTNSRTAKALVNFSLLATTYNCINCSTSVVTVYVILDGVTKSQTITSIENQYSQTTSSSILLNIPIGTHTIKIAAIKSGGPSSDIVIPGPSSIAHTSMNISFYYQ
jgi:hypothetical protein